MKERPILFSAPMIRALLAGRKTQTRRIFKADPFTISAIDRRGAGELKLGMDGYGGLVYYEDAGVTSIPVRCPYGASGDRLWVRESVRLIARAGSRLRGRDVASYVADESQTPLDTWPWKSDRLPAIYMPRGLCRLELEVIGVRIERLQSITEDDARAEGVTVGEPVDAMINGERGKAVFFSARDAFAYLWSGINGAESWKANPWLWVIDFKVTRAEPK